MSDTFDTLGTFIGTGRRTGIFSDEDEQLDGERPPASHSKMDRALFADSIATSIGAILRHLEHHHLRRVFRRHRARAAAPA